MATIQLAVPKVRLSTPKTNRRVIRTHGEKVRKCDICHRSSERRYLVADDLWVCLACVPEEVLIQYPGWVVH